MHTEPSADVLASPRRRTGSLIGFFALTYLLAWTAFVSASRLVEGGARLPLLLLGGAAPSLVALAITAHIEGRPGVRELLRRLLPWRVGLRWYAFAIHMRRPPTRPRASVRRRILRPERSPADRVLDSRP